MAISISGVLRGLALVSLLLAVPPLIAQEERPTRTESVQFGDGAKIKVLEGTIVGGETVDYLVRPAKGQTLSVSLATHHTATHFNVIAPSEGDVVLFDGSLSGNEYEGVAAEAGAYRVRVYITGGDERPEETASYRLEMVLLGSPEAFGAAGSATDGGEQYDATGTVPCAQHMGQPMTQCNFGVIRTGAGAATVLVILPDQSRRIIFFEGGRPTGTDASRADGAGRFRVERADNLSMILAGDERFEIPDTVVSGR